MSANERITKQIKKALDGRTARWLAIKAGIPESELSLRINGHKPYGQSHLDKINSILKTTIKL